MPGSIRPWLGIALATLLWVGASIAVANSGKEPITLPQPRRDGERSVENALARRRSVRDFAADPIPLAAISQLLWAAQGITHPKGYRTTPSAGALYPLELYVVVGAVDGLAPGVYHYDPRHHQLLPHAEGDPRRDLARAAVEQDWVAEAPAIVILAAVTRRSARKYGSRAPRYVHMEVGHAAQNVYLQAGALGLGTCAVGAFSDRQLASTLGLPEGTTPQLVMPVGWPAGPGLRP